MNCLVRFAVLLLIGALSMLASCMSEIPVEADGAVPGEARAPGRMEVSPGSEPTEEGSGSGINHDRRASEAPAQQKRMLDLALRPEDVPIADVQPGAVDEPSRIFPGDLMEKKRSNLSLDVRPQLRPGETPTALPQLEGATIDMQLRTK